MSRKRASKGKKNTWKTIRIFFSLFLILGGYLNVKESPLSGVISIIVGIILLLGKYFFAAGAFLLSKKGKAETAGDVSSATGNKPIPGTTSSAYSEAEIQKKADIELVESNIQGSNREGVIPKGETEDMRPKKPRVKCYPSNERVVENYVVLDLETTGFSPDQNDIIEVAAIKCVNDEVADRFVSFVNPGYPIPKKITEITGITDADVSNAPNIETVAPLVAEFISGAPIVAHNASFDANFLAAAYGALGLKAEIEYIDTLSMAREAYPRLANHKLSTLIEKLGLLDHEQTHRAEDDAEATHHLYTACKKKIAEAQRRRIWEARKKVDAAEGEEKVYELGQLAIELEESGDPQGAISCYLDAAELSEGESKGIKLCNAAAICERIGDENAALKYYQMAIKSGVYGSHPYRRIAILLRRQKRYDEELAFCRFALEELPHAINPVNDDYEDFFQRRIIFTEKKLAKTVSN